MKNIYKIFVICLALCLSGSLFAQYDAGDTMVINTIKNTNFTGSTALNWSDPNPGNWIGVEWDSSSPKRIIGLNLNESSCNGGSRAPSGNFSHYVKTGTVTALTGTLDVSGLDSLKYFEFRRNNGVTAVNVTGLTKLIQISGSRSGVTVLDASNIATLGHLRFRNAPLDSLDIRGCSGLYKVAMGRISGDLLDVKLSGLANVLGKGYKGGLGFKNNSLTLTQAAQLYNYPNCKVNITNQNRYNATQSITTAQTLDYSSEAVIDINGTNVNTVFSVSGSSGAPLSSNSTGIMSFPYPGTYFITMTNSGVTMTTGEITVTGTVGCSSVDAGDSTILKSIATTNFSGTTGLNWLTEPCADSWDGVDWDFSTPRRVVGLNLAQNTSGQGSSGGNGSYCSDVSGGIKWSLSKLSWINHGVTTDLKDTLDVSGLVELRILLLNQNDSVTGLNVTGLNKLERLLVPNTSIKNLVANNLPNLLQFHMKMNQIGSNNTRVESIDVSNCPKLVRFAASWSMDSLRSVNVNGCTNLEKISLKRSPNLNSFQMAGVTKLKKIAIGDNSNGNVGMGYFPTQLYSNPDLIVLGFAGQNATGTLDLSYFPKLVKVGVRNNNFSAIIPTDSSLVDLVKITADDNRLTLTNAVELANNTYANSTSCNPQQNDGYSILYTDSIDYSVHDSIDVTGTLTGSSFSLYTAAGALISTNSTGIFSFVISDTGAYYVEMTNSGITVTTDTIWVVTAGAKIMTSIAAANFGDVNIGQSSTKILTVSNDGNATLDVSNITVPAGYSISGTTGSVAAGASTTFNVTFTPTMPQTYSGDITVSSNSTLIGGVNVVSITGVGIDVTNIDEETAELLTFYPNPTSSILYVKNNKGTFEVLNLYDMQGRLVESIKMTGTSSIDFTNMNRGVYFIRSIDGKINQKVVKY